MPTTNVFDDFTIYDDEIYEGSPALAWGTGGGTIIATLVNWGRIESDSRGVVGNNAEGVFENHGVLSVASTNPFVDVWGLYSPNWAPVIWNLGTWHVSGIDAYGAETYGASLGGVPGMPTADLTNDGDWIVEATNLAIGILLNNGNLVINNGDFIVSSTSGTAWGIIGDGATVVTNTGLIQVTGPDSVGIAFAWSEPGVNINNSGTITAEYAILGITNGDLAPAFNILNTGTINGILDLQRYNDILDNRNVINGDVLTYLGNDLVDTTLGVINGDVYLEGGNDEFRGGVQGQWVSGGDGDDTLTGGGGADEFYGGAGTDALNGGNGDDVLDGGAGADTINGGAGFDLAGYSLAPQAVTVSLLLQGSAQNTGGGDSDTLNGIEDLGGSAYNDTLIGDGAGNYLFGIAGNDTLTGNGGADFLFGGTGRDTATYSIASTGATWARNADGSWTVNAGAQGIDTTSSVEFLDFTDRDVFLDRAAQTFTGDGSSDLLLRHANGTLSLWFVQGGGITGAGVGSISADWTPQAGDFNGDGRDDLLWRNSTNGAMSMWFMNGAAVTGAAFQTVGTSWVIEGIGDFDGDTRDDILWRDSASGAMSLWFLNGTSVSGGAFGNVGSGWVIETLGDFNGDGRDDILWRETASGAMSMWFMNGQAVTGGAFGTVGATWVVEGAGDYNGDGRDDIFWRNGATGDVSLWFMNGQAVTGFAGFGLSTAWHAEGLGDYNADGRDDILWRHDDGTLIAWYINGSNVTGQALGSLSSDWVINPGG